MQKPENAVEVEALDLKKSDQVTQKAPHPLANADLAKAQTTLVQEKPPESITTPTSPHPQAPITSAKINEVKPLADIKDQKPVEVSNIKSPAVATPVQPKLGITPQEEMDPKSRDNPQLSTSLQPNSKPKMATQESGVWDEIADIDKDKFDHSSDNKSMNPDNDMNAVKKFNRLESPVISAKESMSPGPANPSSLSKEGPPPKPDPVVGKARNRLDSDVVLKRGSKDSIQPSSQPKVETGPGNKVTSVIGADLRQAPLPALKTTLPKQPTIEPPTESNLGNMKDRYKRKPRQQDILNFQVKDADRSILGGADIVGMGNSEDFENEFLKRKRKELLR